MTESKPMRANEWMQIVNAVREAQVRLAVNPWPKMEGQITEFDSATTKPWLASWIHEEIARRNPGQLPVGDSLEGRLAHEFARIDLAASHDALRDALVAARKGRRGDVIVIESNDTAYRWLAIERRIVAKITMCRGRRPHVEVFGAEEAEEAFRARKAESKAQAKACAKALAQVAWAIALSDGTGDPAGWQSVRGQHGGTYRRIEDGFRVSRKAAQEQALVFAIVLLQERFAS